MTSPGTSVATRTHRRWSGFTPLAIILCLAFCLSGTGGTLSAQTLRDLVQVELQRTQQIIDRAQDAVAPLHDPHLDDAIRRARDLQKQAEDAFGLERYLLARGLTLQARGIVRGLAGMLRPTEQQDGNLQGRLDHAERMFADATEMAVDPQLQGLLENARANLDRAWDFYRKGDLRPAVKLLEQVERMLDQILGRGHSDEQGGEHFMRRIDAIRDLIDDALALTANCAIPAARIKAEEADRQFDQARQLHEQHRPLLALRALQQARDLATRAIADCDAGVELDQLVTRIEQQRDRLLERIGQRTDDAAESARKLATQARTQIDDAKQALQAKNKETAAANLKAAQLTLRQAERILGHP